MKKLAYTNSKGDSITFDRHNYLFTALTGFGEVGAEIQTQKAPYQDGSTFIDVVLNERAISFEVSILGINESDVAHKRSRLAQVFNPKLGMGKLSYTVGTIERVIDVVVEHVPTFMPGKDVRGRKFQRSVIDLLALNPYWRSEQERVEQLVTFSGGLTFPLILPTIFGNQKSDAKSRIIINDGDSPTPIEVTFEGPATSPIRIENETTGEFIEVAQNLLDGEKLWITTAFGRKRVEKIAVDGSRTNAFHYIYIDPSGAGPSSSFFQLEPGNNLLTYSTGEDYEKAPVTIKFYPRYLAV